MEKIYTVNFTESEYISVKNTLIGMSNMFLALPTHRKANKEKAALLKKISLEKFNLK